MVYVFKKISNIQTHNSTKIQPKLSKSTFSLLEKIWDLSLIRLGKRKTKITKKTSKNYNF